MCIANYYRNHENTYLIKTDFQAVWLLHGYFFKDDKVKRMFTELHWISWIFVDVCKLFFFLTTTTSLFQVPRDPYLRCKSMSFFQIDMGNFVLVVTIWWQDMVDITFCFFTVMAFPVWLYNYSSWSRETSAWSGHCLEISECRYLP